MGTKHNFVVKYLPSGYSYSVEDIYNDNIDVNVIDTDGNVYFATFFTIKNVVHLMEKDNESFFWAADMILVSDLEMSTIEAAIDGLMEYGHFEFAFSKISTPLDP